MPLKQTNQNENKYKTTKKQKHRKKPQNDFILLKNLSTRTLNHIWWWGYISGDLRTMYFPLIFFIPRPTMTRSGSICKNPINESIIIIIIIILLFWEVFTPALVDGFPLEFDWEQVSASLQDSSQYSGRS